MSSFSSHAFKLLINGELRTTADSFPKENPAKSSEIVGQVPEATKADADAAVTSAVNAQKDWKNLSQTEKRNYLTKCRAAYVENKDKFILLLTLEQGKPLPAAAFEYEVGVASFDEALKVEVTPNIVSEDETSVVKVYKRPVGVVAAITPWNFPLFIGIAKVLKAIVTGNTVILKPSPFTPLTSLLFGEICGVLLPPGVLNVLTSRDISTSDFNLGEYLTKHEKINKVSFTGSVKTGKAVLSNATEDLTRVTLELGGNDAAIVCSDVDVSKAAAGVFEGFMVNTGQVCCAIKRCFVHESIYDEFVKKLVEISKARVNEVGDGQEKGITYGPLNNKNQFDIVSSLVKDSKDAGAEIHCGGPKTDTDGYFYLPTIVTGLKDENRLVKEEQFGPVLPILKFSSVDEAIQRANESPYGLGASIWTNDKELAHRACSELLAGTVWVNEHVTFLPGAPFGGFKCSGIGRENDWGEFDIGAFTECQTVKLMK